MSKFVVAIFPDEQKAYEGVHALTELHNEGSVTLYGTTVVQREQNGALSRKQRADQGPIGTGLGMLVGGLIGLFGGPVGAAVGVTAGGLAGGWRDYLHAEVSDEFLENLGKDLSPGKFAVIAEVSEEWNTPIDTRMSALGATVVRERREDFVESMIEKRVDSSKTEIDQWKMERASAKAKKMESKLEEKIGDAREKLQRTAEKARQRLDDTKEEMEEKLRALEAQAQKAKPEVKGQIEHRIAEIRNEFGQRERKLEHAWELAQEALSP
jgi:uncharacterized membrane protein